MKKTILTVALTTLITSLSFGQTIQADIYNIDPVIGNGIRFWTSDNYKIHFGNTSQYWYGPVINDFAIKMNMSSNTGRGWVWGLNNTQPVTALSNLGEFRTKGYIISDHRIGIGLAATSTPSKQFELQDAVQSSSILGSNNDCAIRMNNWDWSIGNRSEVQFGIDPSTQIATIAAEYSGFGTGAQGDIIFGTSSNGADANAMIEKMRITHDGKVTIGSGGPSSTTKFSVLASTNTDYAAFIQNGGGTGKGLLIKGGVSGSSQPEFALLRVTNYAGDDIFMVEGANKRVYAREIIVNLNSWPDYVFESNYQLKSLGEIEEFINQNHHLPGVPSQEEIIDGGVNLGEMDAILLQKIEELTLHLIALEKEKEKLKAIVYKK